MLSGIYRDLAAAFLAAMAAAALLALGMSWHFTRRLKRLAAASAAIGEGRFGIKAGTEGSDENIELGAAFNAMSERLLEVREHEETVHRLHNPRTPLPAGCYRNLRGLLLREKERFTEQDAGIFLRIKENAGRLEISSRPCSIWRK